MGRYRRKLSSLIAVLVLVSAMAFFNATSTASTRDRQFGNKRPVVVVRSAPNMATVADIKIDSSRNRVFVSYPDANVVEVLGYDGSLIATVPVPGPERMSLGPNALFVVAQQTGSVQQIDLASLASTTVVSGLNSPHGLTYNNGSLYTLESNTAVIRVDPILRTKLALVTDYRVPGSLADLIDPSPIPDVLLGRGDGVLSRYSLATQVLTTGAWNMWCAGLDNGELLVLGTFGLKALKAVTLEDSNRQWTTREGNYWPTGCDASQGTVVAITTADTNTHVVHVFEQDNPGKFVGGYTISGVSEMAGLTRFSSDGEVIVHPARRANGVNLYFLPALSYGAPQGVPASPRARSSAPSAETVVGPAPRQSASPTWTPAQELYSLDAWAIDTEYVYAASARQGIVNVYSLDGRGIASIRDLPHPRSMVICGGETFVGLLGSGQVVKIEKGTWRALLVADNVPAVAHLVCVGDSTLYAAGIPDELSPDRASFWRITGGVAVALPHHGFGIWSKLARNVPTTRFILSENTSQYTEFDPTYPPMPTTFPRPGSHAAPWADLVNYNVDNTKLIDRTGYVYENGILRSGTRFNGLRASWSKTSPGYIATTDYEGSTISMYDDADPSAPLAMLYVNSNYKAIDMSFGMGTRTLFVVLQDVSSGNIYVVPAPDVLG